MQLKPRGKKKGNDAARKKTHTNNNQNHTGKSKQNWERKRRRTNKKNGKKATESRFFSFSLPHFFAHSLKRLANMLDVLNALKQSHLFHASRLQLDVVPKHKTFALNGYIRLRNYEPIPTEKESHRFLGEESRQIKTALKKVLPKDLVIEVKLEPNVQQFKGGAYLFTITRTFPDRHAMDFSLAEMIDDGTIDEHVFHVHSKWAAEISGGHTH